MERFGNDLFSLAGIRETDMVGYLAKLGFKPEAIKKKGTDYWYLSPLRNESTASFHVDTVSNSWYDFGLMAGGNMVDFCLRFYGCSIPELLVKFNADFSVVTLPVFDAGLHEGRVSEESKLVVTDVRPLYAYPLKNYLHERSIPVAVAEVFCSEVTYQINGNSYYGIGFKNDAGGYEIRNKNYKQSSSPKDITTFYFGADSVNVFEGFMDFLSYQTLHPYMEPGTCDFVVLNGAGLFDRALPFLERHERVGLWLDLDVTGKAYTQYALSMGLKYRDESGWYSRHKDLNEWLMQKGEVQQPRLKPGLRLPVGS
ncbi:toprim domain-containing protein [Mucilaginibacter sp. L3T2-6]|uniref:toprim domain-containing protein n=1 Tax=Mucilaginibacter sp. L3T2-6 TaxID=3062491 RepID=UPI0026771915|nr:toprim domain-containing protein [Mucilaginibacter sp. L3T2-6]MDO3641348.1 toprim domain-containing protein [Mucilaginibacter sp. L3T2-6]MDV6213891.1 toprim domain-containing protein [Mucilaginibacter sp. L3T2-6]